VDGFITLRFILWTLLEDVWNWEWILPTV